MKKEVLRIKPGEVSIYEQLRTDILTAKLKPGERIWEQHLANQFGVSRTPVREALKRLEAEKLVTILPHKGAMVARIRLDDVLEFFQVRAVLEGLAARLAIDHMGLKDIEKMEDILAEMEKVQQDGNVVAETELDYRLHEVIWKDNSHNAKLIDMLSTITEQIMRFRILSRGIKGRAEIVLGEHKAIVKALKERNKDEAEQIINQHILGVQKHLLTNLGEGSE